MSVDLVAEGPLLGAELSLPSGPASLRLRRLAGRWLAVATGPLGEVEVGADASPYLAAQLALETWQPDVVSVMLVVGRLRPAGPDAAPESGAEPEPEPAGARRVPQASA